MDFIQIVDKVRNNETISAGELDQLLTWLLSEEGHREFLSAVEYRWHAFKTNETVDYEEMLLRVKQRINEVQPKAALPAAMPKYIRYMMEVAAVVLLALGLSFFMRPQKDDLHTLPPAHKEWVEIYNPKGLRTTIILPDSSKVILNADSRIAYFRNFAGNSRNVTLHGEALFEVEKDSLRPFTVQAHDATMTVLGTTFNVRSYDDESYIETTLIEGALKVDVGKEESLLAPGRRISIHKNSQKSSIQTVNAKNIIGWIDGKLYLESLPFLEIVNILERTYNVNINVANSTLRQKKFTGKFENGENLEQILEVIKLSVHFTYAYDKRSNTIIIY